MRRDPTIRAFFERVMRGEPDRKKIALVATAHYLCRVMAAILRTGEVWRTSGSTVTKPNNGNNGQSGQNA